MFSTHWCMVIKSIFHITHKQTMKYLFKLLLVIIIMIIATPLILVDALWHFRTTNFDIYTLCISKIKQIFIKLYLNFKK